MVVKALLADLNEIKRPTEARAIVIQQQDIFQWNEPYSDRGKLTGNLITEELFNPFFITKSY